MGQYSKKYMIVLCVALMTWLPVSVAFASVDCLFHENSTQAAESSVDVSHHENIFGDLTDIQTVNVDTHSMDSSCSPQMLSAATAAYNDTASARNIWGQSFNSEDLTSRLTSIPLPQEIRPPISI